MRTRPPIPKPEKKPEIKPESKPIENPPSLEPVKPGTEPVPKPLIAANEQIGQELVNDRPKARPGRPSKDSAQVVIADPVKKEPVKYPDPTPETNAMAQVLVETLCGSMALALGDHCAYDKDRDQLMVTAWSKYFAFKGFTDFPPSYMALGATAIYIARVATDPKTRKHIEDRKKAKAEKAEKIAAAMNN